MQNIFKEYFVIINFSLDFKNTNGCIGECICSDTVLNVFVVIKYECAALMKLRLRTLNVFVVQNMAALRFKMLVIISRGTQLQQCLLFRNITAACNSDSGEGKRGNPYSSMPSCCW
jgi:hypothetical protein